MSARVAGALSGRRVAVTRRREQAVAIVELLRARGAEPVTCATIAIEPPPSYAELDAALRSIEHYDWVTFTSTNAVERVATRASELGVVIPATVRLAAVGEATARTLLEQIRAPDFVPRTALAASLAEEIMDVEGRRILFPRGDLASERLGRGLRGRGARVDEVVVYRTVPGDGAVELAGLVHTGQVDAILFMSTSSVRYLADAMHARGVEPGRGSAAPAVICVGPETARAARHVGFDVSAVAELGTAEGVVDALESLYARTEDATRD